MTLRRHGHSELNTLDTNDEDQGADAIDRLEEAVSSLLADLARRDPELCRHLQARLTSGGARAAGGPDARARAGHPIMMGRGAPRSAVVGDAARIAVLDGGADLTRPSGARSARWRQAEGPLLELSVATSDGRAVTLDQAKSRVEEVFVRAALERNAFNVSAAANDLGVSRVTLYRHMDRFGLRPGGTAAAR